MTCTCDVDTEVEDKRNYTEVTDEDGQVTITYYLRGYIDQAQAGAFIDLMHFWHASDNIADWHIVITSGGGELPFGTAMASVLRSYSIRGGGTHDVTTRVAGYAASAGHLIFESGDHRTGGDMDFIMLHEPLNDFTESSPTAIRAELLMADLWVDQFIQVIGERCTLTPETLRKSFAGKDWWLTMEAAIAVGLADWIV